MLQPPNDALDSEEFLRFLSITTNSACHHEDRVQVLRNGEEFYGTELAAIKASQRDAQLTFL
jgi:hypothetical protein